MAKGKETRRHIVARAAPVFNTHGYSGTSMSELLKATGLEKGGIYNHFASKEALALAAFDYAIEQSAERFQIALADKAHARERLLAIVESFARYVDDPPIPGGCPIINTAVEADDTVEPLRLRAQSAMTDLQKLIGSTVKRGVQAAELRADADPYRVAAIITALIEGAVVISRLYGDRTYVEHAVAHLADYIDTLMP